MKTLSGRCSTSKEGKSNTILTGDGNISTSDYSKTEGVVGASNNFVGGPGTMRGGPNWQPWRAPDVTLQADSPSTPDLARCGWVGPSTQGGVTPELDVED